MSGYEAAEEFVDDRIGPEETGGRTTSELRDSCELHMAFTHLLLRKLRLTRCPEEISKLFSHVLTSLALDATLHHIEVVEK